MQTITIEKTGRRYYFLGNTYPIKDQLRSAGARWDSDRRAWYTGKADVAERFSGASSDGSEQIREAPGINAVVAGRASYKGRTYYLAGRERDGDVEMVTSRGGRVLLYFRDGSSQFWADQSQVQVVKSYRSATTIRKVQEFAAAVRDGSGSAGTCAECGCSSARLSDCADSSGLVGGCCPRCAAMSRYERSFA